MLPTPSANQQQCRRLSHASSLSHFSFCPLPLPPRGESSLLQDHLSSWRSVTFVTSRKVIYSQASGIGKWTSLGLLCFPQVSAKLSYIQWWVRGWGRAEGQTQRSPGHTQAALPGSLGGLWWFHVAWFTLGRLRLMCKEEIIFHPQHREKKRWFSGKLTVSDKTKKLASHFCPLSIGAVPQSLLQWWKSIVSIAHCSGQ